eukprot:4817954-Pyramimonas_sp.AAC.2
MGIVSRSGDSVFVDFDSVPEDGISVKEAVRYLLSPSAQSLRDLLEGEAINASDILIRQATRKLYSRYTYSRLSENDKSFQTHY